MKIKGIFCEAGLFARIILLLGIVSISLILLGVGYSIFYSLISGESTQNLTGNPNFMKGSQLIQSIAIFILPSLLMAFLISNHPFRYLDMNRGPNFRNLFLTIVSMIAIIPAMNLIIEWNEQIRLPESMATLENWFRSKEDLMGETTKLLLQTDSTGGWIFNLFLVGVVAAISEEMFFRGILQNFFLEKWKNPHIAIWLAAFIFSAIHLQFYGFFPRMLLGAFFGYLLIWTKTLWIPIFAHFINNAIALFQFYLEHKGADPQEWMESLQAGGQYLPAIGSLIILGFTIILFKRSSPNSKTAL